MVNLISLIRRHLDAATTFRISSRIDANDDGALLDDTTGLAGKLFGR